jgi:hypothetical protein
MSTLTSSGLSVGPCEEQAAERDAAQDALLAVVAGNSASLLVGVKSSGGSETESGSRKNSFDAASERLNRALEAWGECNGLVSDSG